jgi:hypothetical protein
VHQPIPPELDAGLERRPERGAPREGGEDHAEAHLDGQVRVRVGEVGAPRQQCALEPIREIRDGTMPAAADPIVHRASQHRHAEHPNVEREAAGDCLHCGPDHLLGRQLVPSGTVERGDVQRLDLAHETLVDRLEQRILVLEPSVDHPDGHSGGLGDGGDREALPAVGGKHLDNTNRACGHFRT